MTLQVQCPRLYIVILATLFIAASCSPQTFTSTTTPDVTSPTKETSLPTLIPIDTPTSMPMLNRYSIECTEVIETTPSGSLFEGVLAIDSYLEDESSYLLNLTTGQVTMIGRAMSSTMAVSPNRTLLAYWDIDQYVVTITDPSGKELKEIPDPDERYTPTQWISDNQLALDYRRREWNEPFMLDSLIILNPFTGERREYLPELPNIDDILNDISWNDYFGSRMVPNSSTSFFIYPALDEDGNFSLILWDSGQQNEITRVYQFYASSGIAVGTPKWSSDGSSFITSAQLRYVLDPSTGSVSPIVFDDDKIKNAYINVDDNQPYLGGFELVRVETMRSIKRLSYLTTEFNFPMQSDWSWSPDERWVAFWLQFLTEDNGYTDPQLAILNLETGEVTNTCLKGGGELIWSPNSKHIAIHVYPEDKYNPDVALLDLDEDIAVIIARDASIGGWLVSPE